MATRRLDSKSARVRELLARGLGAGDIARQVGCTVGLVYNVKSRMGDAPKRGPGRPPKARTPATVGIDDFIESIRRGEKERERLRAALQRVAALVAEVL
jgi:hypothetical protein